jgi:hypothetical protein
LFGQVQAQGFLNFFNPSPVDENDPEIEILKKIITELTFNHPCWGERMPNAWVPLELEIAELTAEGKQILSTYNNIVFQLWSVEVDNFPQRMLNL